MGRHDHAPFPIGRSFGPTFSRKSVFEELLDGWIAVLDDQLDQPSALGPSARERAEIEAARGTYLSLRDGVRD